MTQEAADCCRAIGARLEEAGLYSAPDQTWRISPDPFWLGRDEVAFFEHLGHHLHAFYGAVNQLYHASRKGHQPDWVCRYFDQGKPEQVIEFGRMNRFKSQLPGVIRPDMIPIGAAPSAPQLIITELDSVPGGIGLTAALGRVYSDVGAQQAAPLQIIGGTEGMLDGFASMLSSTANRSHSSAEDAVSAIVVSDESRDYRAEMAWLASQLAERGADITACAPEQLRFTDPQLECQINDRWRPIQTLYRFFELFDLPNIPKAELILYAARKGLIAMTPPPKSYLEEKLVFALLHHPALLSYWKSALPSDTLSMLLELIPPTWIVDPRPLPPQAVIHGLVVDGRPVGSWKQVAQASQKGRHLVLKPSGFSPLAWGSRGVSVGHDLSQEAWTQALERALVEFDQTPSVLQPFLSGRPYTMSYWNDDAGRMEAVEGRVRLSPYYFSTEDDIRLGGILATHCPMDKKLLHGMTDAILAPCAIRD